jgi:hypothetical protein
VSCCEGLERLEVPWGVFESLPPTCPAFKRLTQLHLTNWVGGIDLSSPVWERVGSGLLPALADLSICCKRLWWVRDEEGDGGECLLMGALEAVAGTLRRLALRSIRKPEPPPVVACHELGVAIGKLRRLRYLSLCLSGDGRSYQAAGRGLAASGGCPPLFELHLDGAGRDIDRIVYEPSLIVPTVRHLHVWGGGTEVGEEALVVCCGLVQMGYKHHFTHNFHQYRFPYACLLAVLKARGASAYP